MTQEKEQWKLYLRLAGIWPEAGQACPHSPAEMRQAINTVSERVNGRSLLALFYVANTIFIISGEEVIADV